MPQRAPRVCPHCGQVYRAAQCPCAPTREERRRAYRDRIARKRDHRAENAGRPSAARRGYDADWRRLRASYLASHPLCVLCEAKGRLARAQVVDHITPLSAGGARLDPDNLQSLCKRCHDSVKQRSDASKRRRKRKPRTRTKPSPPWVGGGRR